MSLVIENEICKVFPLNGLYYASENGNVYSIGQKQRNKNGEEYIKYRVKNIKGSYDKYGYKTTKIRINGKEKRVKLHRIVCMAFHDNKLNKKEVNHINGRKDDNRACNLEWSTRKENNDHAIRTGLIVCKKGDDHYRTKIQKADYILVYMYDNIFRLTQKEIGEMFNVDRRIIGKIIRRFR